MQNDAWCLLSDAAVTSGWCADTLATPRVFFLTGRRVWSLEAQLEVESVVCSWTGFLCADIAGHQNQACLVQSVSLWKTVITFATRLLYIHSCSCLAAYFIEGITGR